MGRLGARGRRLGIWQKCVLQGSVLVAIVACRRKGIWQGSGLVVIEAWIKRDTSCKMTVNAHNTYKKAVNRCSKRCRLGPPGFVGRCRCS